MKSQDEAPPRATSAASAKGHSKWPVRSKINPVRAGATIPAKFPEPFCKPVQRPAAYGPARVCEMAQMLDELMPWQAMPRMRRGTFHAGGLTAERKSNTPAPARPPATKGLRTRVGVPPERIKRSESQPEHIARRALRI